MKEASMKCDFNERQPHWNGMHLTKNCIQIIFSGKIYIDQL